jgi:hypothetical protein
MPDRVEKMAINKEENKMGEIIAEKIFDAHRVDEPFPDTHVQLRHVCH